MSDYPKCKTCKHWKMDGPNRGTCAQFEIMPMPNRNGVLCPIDKYPRSVTVNFRPPSTFGCVLHSDLTEATP